MQLALLFFNEFYRHLVIGLGHVLLKEDLSVQHLQPALDILKTKTYIALIQFVEIILRNAATVVVQPDEELLSTGVLRQMDETGIAVLQDIVHQFLDHPEYDQLGLRLQPFAVIMEPGAGIHAAGTADLLEQVIDGGFQPEILQGRRHQAVRDIADELDRIVDDLLGVVDALQLRGLVEIDQILVQV